MLYKDKFMAVKCSTAFTAISMAINLKIMTMNFYIMFIIAINKITSVLCNFFFLLMPIR